jgi:hypothetical protein
MVIDEDAAFITKVKESNAGGMLSFWVGTQAQYNALASIDKNCLYIITDKQANSSDMGTFVEDVEHLGCYCRDANGEKEWLNPPLFEGEPYRTTERFNGAPVYIRMKRDFVANEPNANRYAQIPVTDFDALLEYGVICTKESGRGWKIPWNMVEGLKVSAEVQEISNVVGSQWVKSEVVTFTTTAESSNDVTEALYWVKYAKRSDT